MKQRIWIPPFNPGWRVWEVGRGREEKVASMAWCVRLETAWNENVYANTPEMGGWWAFLEYRYLILKLSFLVLWKYKFFLSVSFLHKPWINSTTFPKSLWHVSWKPREKLCYVFEWILWENRDRTHQSKIPMSVVIVKTSPWTGEHLEECLRLPQGVSSGLKPINHMPKFC